MSSSPPTISSKSSTTTTTSLKETMVKNKNLSPFLIEKIKQFLDDYQCELRFKKLNQSLTKTSTSSSLRTFSSMISGGGNSGGYDYGYGNNNSNMIADPTTANALQTSTVVLRKKKNKNKNLSFDGIQLSNYRIKFNNVYGEIFDWIYHFLWLKNCPIELATIVAIQIATKMSQDILNEFNLNNNNSLNMMNNINNNNNNNNIDTIDTKHHNNHLDHHHQSNIMDTTTSSFDDIQMDKSPALSSLSSPLNISSATTIMADNYNESPTTTTSTIDGTMMMMMERSSLPSALCSHDLAKQSRELVDDCLQQFGNNPDHAISMVNDYLDNNDNHCKSFENSTTNNSNNDDDNSKSLSTTFKTSVSAIKNRRQSMEDRHIIIQNLNKALSLDLPKTYSYYAIFDGHAGIDAASYSTAHLHHYLVESEAFRNGQMEDAFRQAFHKTDELYIKRLREDGIDKLKPSGTTAICALIEDNKNVYLAWAGDSQAVLVRNGCHEEIMLPHKPDMESERIRIQDQGGLVIYMDTWRVNGILSVTRAIGDPEHKSLIIADPSFSTFQIDSSLDFLVLGCDGLFDHLNGQDITSNVFEYLCKNENNDPELVQQGVSAYLAEQAIQEGSSDNITSIVIFFKPFEQLIATGLYPTNQIESNQEEESMIINDTNAAALPTTNGGHFPYTDFAELPIGINYKLTSNENLSSPTTTIDLDGQNYQSQSIVSNNNTNDIIESSMELPESEEQPIENNDVDIDDNNLEHCQDEFDFVRTTTTPTETIILNDNNNQTKSIDIDDNNCLMVDEQQQQPEQEDQKEQEQQQQLKEELSSSSAATIMEKTLLSDYNNDDNNNSGGVGGGKILSSINVDDNNGENFDQHFNHHNDDHEEQQQQQQQEENSKVLIEQSKPKSFMNEFDDNQQQQQMDQMDNFFNQSSFNNTNNMNNNPFDLLADQKTSTSSTNRTSINPFENSNANITIMSASPFDDNNDTDGDGDGDGGNIMNMEQSNNDQTEILSISNDPMMDMMMMINQSDSKIVDAAAIAGAALDSSYDNDDNELADDFMFVQPNRSTDESTNFPTATTTITENIPGTMISPMLLMNSQFESGLLYNQQEQQQQPEPETDDSCLIQNEPQVLFENDVDQPSTNDHFESNELKEPQEPVDFKQPEIICDIGTTTASAVEEGECSKSFEIQNDSMFDEKMIDIDLSAGQQAPVTTTVIDDFVDEMSALTLQNNSEIMNIATNDYQKNGDILINNEMSNLNNEIINDNNLEDSKVVLDDQDQINHVERSVPKFEETNLDDNLVSLPPQSANEIQIPLVEPATTVDKKEEEISEKVLSEIQPTVTAAAAAVAAASAVAVKSTVPSKATIKTASSTKLPATKPTTTAKTTLSNTKKTGVATKLSNSGTKTSLAPKTTNRLTTATAKSSSTTTATSNKPTTNAKIGDKKPLTSTISSSRLTTATNRSTTATNRPTVSTTKSSTATALSAKPMRTALTTRTATTTTALKSTSTKPASTTSTTAASSVPKTTRPTTTTAATKTALKPRTAITSSTNVAAKKPMTTSTTGSKVGSIRPATKTTTTTTTNAINKPLASKATNITKKITPITKSSAISSTLKKTNNTQNDVKKTVPKIPRTSSTTTATAKSTTTNGVSNGDSGKNMAVPKKRPPPPPTPQQQPPSTLMTTSNYSHKRTSLISPENSLKQELEDAALNEMNANAALEAAAVAAAAAASASEQFNGSN